MSESAVYLDPAEVDAFAARLSETVDYYGRVVERLEANIGRLGRTWRDQQFEEFQEEVRTLRQGLTSYMDEARAARRTLGQLADAARAYHRIQPPR
jgi:uncharacterized protein YukE